MHGMSGQQFQFPLEIFSQSLRKVLHAAPAPYATGAPYYYFKSILSYNPPLFELYLITALEALAGAPLLRSWTDLRLHRRCYRRRRSRSLRPPGVKIHKSRKSMDDIAVSNQQCALDETQSPAFTRIFSSAKDGLVRIRIYRDEDDCAA